MRAWDLTTGLATRTLTTLDDTIAHETEGRGVAFLPDGRSYASVDLAGALRVWDLATSEQRSLQSISNAAALAITADGKRAFVSSPGDAPTYVFELGGDGLFPKAITSAHTDAFAITPDGRRLLCVKGRTIGLWDPGSDADAPVASFDVGSMWDHVRSAAFAPDGRTFAVGTTRGVALVFELR